MENSMDINKVSWSTDKQNIRLSMPIAKVDKERRIVSGFATLDNVDKQGDIVPAEASIKAFETFRGNLREMHQPVAVGKVVSFKEDKYFDQESKKFYNGVFVSAYVSKGAQDTWEKVLDGTLTGFSIGGSIDKADDIYDENLDKPIRVIKEYQLNELSLVDNPANQFANVVSIEKGVATGYLTKAVIENIFWCNSDDIVRLSGDNSSACPQCDKSMYNIGFVENNDIDKANVIKSILLETKRKELSKSVNENAYVKCDNFYGKVIQMIEKGSARISNDEMALFAKENDPIAVIRVYSQKEGTIVPTSRRVIKNVSSLETINTINKSQVKEVSKMEDTNIEPTSVDEVAKSDVIVVDEFDTDVTKAVNMNQEQMNPEPQTAFAVKENAETEMDDAGDNLATEADPKADAAEDAAEGEMDDPNMKAMGPGGKGYDAELHATKSILSDVTVAISSLAETMKSINAKIEDLSKEVTGVRGEVKEVKDNYDNFGKRVDAVEKDTAFRKSGDLGEIVQENPVIMEKSLWDGRFLTNADLFK
jgi:hypothetical protein